MRLTAISDIHIRDREDPWFRALLDLMQGCSGQGNTLILAGDVFDLFVGNRPVFTQRYRDFLELLRSLARAGTEIHYIEGNHDFHLRAVMPIARGIHLHAAETELTLSGKRFYVAHGDLVDRKDFSYLLLRSFFRSPVVKIIAHTAPSGWIEKLGEVAQKKSEATRTDRDEEEESRDYEHTRRAFRNFAAEKVMQGYDYVILGHCHDADEMVFKVGERSGQYVNIGHPKTHGTYLFWEPGQERIERRKLSVQGQEQREPQRSGTHSSLDRSQ